MKLLIVTLVIVLTLFLTACKVEPNGDVVFATLDIPDSLLHCVPAPMRDKPFIKVNERQAALLLARYKTAHDDCYSKLLAVRDLYLKYKNDAKPFTVENSNETLFDKVKKWVP